MSSCENLIRNLSVLDGSGSAPEPLSAALRDGMICAMGAIHHSIAEKNMRRPALTLFDPKSIIDTATYADPSSLQLASREFGAMAFLLTQIKEHRASALVVL